ncbi:beta-N-acetylhexosaminidase [bacterium]|nr:beta-N-acetylhexosaminidase [bacterium]
MLKKSIKAAGLILVSLLIINGENTVQAAENGALAIIPKPVKVLPQEGSFTLKKGLVISQSGQVPPELGHYLAGQIVAASGFTPAVTIVSGGKVPDGSIRLSLDESLSSTLGDEGYSLIIAPVSVKLTAPKPAGLFYGIQTLRQLLDSRKGTTPALPCAEIEDRPVYSWRGMSLDCARHFMTIDFIKRYIDLLAYHKMNVFHWHLTDDQGWRIEIKRYPRLTGIGAWREEYGERYGGFYTQEEAKDIVAYAKSRYITVVPEIEMPGHATAAVAAYPPLSCSGKPVNVETGWGVFTNLFCAGKDETFVFLENVLNEICEIFPSPYIHIGGDEAKKDQWEKCPLCQKRIKDEGLKDERELQGYFTKRIDAFMQSKGRTIIGWDEILEGGISPGAVVQSWRGMKGAEEGTRKGHRVISSPHDYTYFDYPLYSLRSKAWWMGITPPEKTYSFQPAPDNFTKEQAALIMGGECCMWAEYAPQPEIDQQVFPRLCALCEVLWTPKEQRDWNDFSGRMETHYRRLDALGVDYYKEDVRVGGWTSDRISPTLKDVEWDITKYMKGNGHYRVTFDHEKGDGGISVEWAALLRNGGEISRDPHPFQSSDKNLYQTYRFTVDNHRDNDVYTLRVHMSGRNGTDTTGSIWLNYFHSSVAQKQK